MSEPDVRDRHDAVTGWRYWQVTPRSGQGPSGPLSGEQGPSGPLSGEQLRSVTQKRVEWPPGHILVARCTGAGHKAPEASCECGIYGARDLETLREHGLCLVPEVLVVGTVALWGRVIDDVSGWRGEFAQPVELLVVDDLVPGLDAADLAARLGSVYRVPAATMPLADAVAGASATMLTFQAMSARASRSGQGHD